MKDRLDLSPLKRIPVLDVARHLGIPVCGTKAMCFMGHDKASPSLSFHKVRNTWRCFGACGKHGDTIALVMEKENLDFNSALEWFAQSFGVDVRQAGGNHRRAIQRQSKIPAEAAHAVAQNTIEFAADTELYAWLLNQCPVVSSPKGIAYLASHGISPESANRFNIRELHDPEPLFGRLVEKWGAQRVYRSGLAWGKEASPESLIWGSPAILFPFHEQGSIIYLQARMHEGARKYLNPRGIAKPLFNTDCLSHLPAGSWFIFVKEFPMRSPWKRTGWRRWVCSGPRPSGPNGQINS
jgi:DNA primase